MTALASRSTIQCHHAAPRAAIRWGGWLALWTLVALVLFSQDVVEVVRAHQPDLWRPLLLCWLTRSYSWALFSLLVRWLTQRFPIRRQRTLRYWGLHLLFSLLIGLAAAAVATWVGSLLQIPWYLPDFRSAFPEVLVSNFPVDVFTYWLTAAGWEAMRGYRQYREQTQRALRSELQMSDLRGQLAHAQLAVLKNQLQPHFLFNTLNGIMTLVRRQDTSQAEEMLSRLSDLLRCILRDTDAQEVALGRELEFLRLYLAIEEVRFQERLRIQIEVAPELRQAMVPNMCLQPLVENAIRHGVGCSTAIGTITIRAERADNTLKMEVRDSGARQQPRPGTIGAGIGLSNTRARLRSLYGNAGRVFIEILPDGGTVAILMIPYHAAVSADTALQVA